MFPTSGLSAPPPGRSGQAKIPTSRYMSKTTSKTRPRTDGRSSARRGTARERLLDAASTLFAERGYHAASVDQIVAAAGVTKGALYGHFASKQELFVGLLE